MLSHLTCTSFHLEILSIASHKLGDKPWVMFSTKTLSNDCKKITILYTENTYVTSTLKNMACYVEHAT